ncbi:MAG: hypothetical protein AAGL89_10700 [Pseudomonadota bacterium]
MPPVDTKYVAGLFHHDRATFKGISLEARVLLKSLTIRSKPNDRFLIVGRARSGTTLLTKLLNGHSEIECDGEILKRFMISPKAYFNRLANKSLFPVYGAKLLSYQMAQVHRMRRPDLFLRQLEDDGVLLIHIERETLSQTLSLAVAQHRRQFHSDRGAVALGRKLRLDCDDFVRRLEWSEALLRYERAAFAGIDHLKVIYETHLADPAAQITTLERICGRLNMAAEPVEMPIKKLLPTQPDGIIENFEEVAAAIRKAGFEQLLPQI